MDIQKRFVLNKYHVLFLMQNTITGLGLITFAYDISAVKYGIWLIPIFLGIILTILLFFMVKLSSKFPNDNLFKINEKLLGKFIGKILNTMIVFYAIFIVAMLIDGYVRVIQTITLPNESVLLPALVLVFATVLIARGGIKSIARFCIISFFFTIWMLYFLQWSFAMAIWTHFFPLFNFTLKEVFISTQEAMKSFLGLEAILFYYPFIREKKKAFKHSAIGLWIVILLYVVICISILVSFSPWQLQNVRNPILSLFQAVELSFLERIENLGLNLWVFLILSTTSCYLWIASKGISSITNKNQIWYMYITAICVTIINILPINSIHRETMENISVSFGFFLIVLPLFLLIISVFKKTKEGG